MKSLVILQSSLLFCVSVLITSHVFICYVMACSDLQIFISKLDFLPIRTRIWVSDMSVGLPPWWIPLAVLLLLLLLSRFSRVRLCGCTTGTSNPTSTTDISHCLSPCIISIFHPIQLFFCSLNWLLILLFTQSPVTSSTFILNSFLTFIFLQSSGV